VVSYWWYIGTMRLSCTVTEIWGPKDIGCYDLDLLGSRDVSDQVTIGLGVGTLILVVNDDHAPILHRYGDTGLQRFWCHEFDLLGSSDVIGHVTIRLGICGFLFPKRLDPCVRPRCPSHRA